MVQFNITYDVANSPDYNALSDVERQTILNTLTAAALWWTRYLAPINVTLDMSIYIDAEPFEAGTLALGGPDLYENGQFDEGVPVWEPATQTKLVSGVDPNGADADLAIWLSPDATHENFYFAPLDVDGIYTIPSGMIDAMSVFLHEIGHGLGFISFSDLITDPSFSQERTTYDTLIHNQAGLGTVFDGPTAGFVRLQMGSMSHTSEPLLAHDLMSPQIGAQEIARITPIDVAIMRDYGIPMRGPTAGNDVLYGFAQVDAQFTGADSIAAGAGNDIVYGLTGDDSLFGGAGGDELYGQQHNDQLFGDEGNDTLVGDFGNDTLNGGGGLDVARYTGMRSEYTVTKVGTTHVVNGPEGSDTLFAIERIQFSDQTLSVALAPAGDFSGEGNGDLLWQNDSGQAASWLMSGLAVTTGSFVGGAPSAGWTEIGSGDFNGDGKADILWQNANDGQAATWLLDGFNVTNGATIGGAPGTDWKIMCAGDFDGDMKSDILWQNTSTLQAAVWLMNGLAMSAGSFIGGAPSAGWKVVCSGDFNGDGRSDILWQNTVTNQAAAWLMNGFGVASGGFVGGAPSAGWVVKGSGDFNGDGKSDLLWQNTTDGQAAIWFLNGLSMTGGGYAGGAPSAGWNVVGAADYDGNGRSDILWQNTSGQAAVWLMNGLAVSSGGIVGGNPGPTWHLIGAAG